jgi:hypothetical protein
VLCLFIIFLSLGGGNLGTGGGVTQPPNLIRFIANTIRDVGSAQKGGGSNGNAAVFTNLLQQLLVLIFFKLGVSHRNNLYVCV